jgi:transmembrane sensor
MTKEELDDLLDRYEKGLCTRKEQALLEKWIAGRINDNSWSWSSDAEKAAIKKEMKSNIWGQIFNQKSVVKFTQRHVAIAASILIFSSLAIWLYVGHQSVNPAVKFYTKYATQPGSKTARLTLADGTAIWLDKTKLGTIYKKDGITIKKLANGELQYETGNLPQDQSAVVPDNTISVPHGGQFQLELPDGTKVWLNSATQLTYPVAFTGNIRRVKLSGEAYFEVAKNKRQPFMVAANNTEISVTGTIFNVSAYSDDRQVVTTLLEGGVDVFRGSSRARLRPGYEAVTTAGSTDIQTREVVAEDALAWLHGDFLFENQPIESIMKNVSRWYNVEVVFTGQPNSKTFGGTFSRTKGLKELLTHLESLSDIRFNYIEGRVTVMR